MSTEKRLRALLSEQIVVIDGAMGTMIQRYALDEEAFRGTAYRDHSQALAGCNDLLSITQPQVIGEIHRQFLQIRLDDSATFPDQTRMLPCRTRRLPLSRL